MVEAYDQGQLIHDSVIGVRDAILIRIALTVGVLALFFSGTRARGSWPPCPCPSP